MPKSYICTRCRDGVHGCKVPCDCPCREPKETNVKPIGPAVGGPWLYCRRGDHHLCPVELTEERCGCPCHQRDVEERKAAYG